MPGIKRGSQGFTLVASLLMLLLMSGLAIGLLMMVNTESRVGGNDLENNLAYHDAEGAIEKMTADLANTFQTVQAPSNNAIIALGTNPGPPNNDPMVTYTDYSLTPVQNAQGGFVNYHYIQTGPNQGLFAQLMDVNLKATAQRPLGDQVSMMRTVEVALIPVFQFGVFSQSDLGFFNSPNLDFNGRVHTNGDLYLGVAQGFTLNFHDKVTAYGNVIRQVLPNGLSATTYSDTGVVNILSAAGGCSMMPAGPAGPNCKPIAINQGSVVLGPNSAQNGTWNNTSQNYYNGWLADGNYGQPGGTGVRSLSLPFTGGGAQPFEIIRRPPAGEALNSAVAQSRLINQAQIRVLLSDTQAALHMADWNGNPAQDVELASLVPNCLLPGGAGWAQNGIVVGGATYYFGEARTATDANYVIPPTFHGAALPCNTEWPLIDGWLLVEFKNAAGNWVGVTQEWLQLGFARGLNPPNSEIGAANTVHANAILIFQQQADRNGDHTLTNAGDVAINTSGANSQYNWLPINLYDAREGEVRDVAQGNASCTPNGIMNAVELDVRNLQRWLAGTIGATGNQVDFTTENGYILYFSDRRGMLPDPLNLPGPALMGEYGFEDTINSSTVAGNPDNASEPPLPSKTVSPEDVNGNGRLDTYGAVNVGDGFGVNTNTNPRNPYGAARIANCYTTGRKNRVTGARHALKLVDGTLGNLPVMPVAVNGSVGGFTVGSENPVYIQGNYNTSAADPTWGNPNAAEPAHAAAGIIADAVSLLSNAWQDNGYPAAVGGNIVSGGSLRYPTGATNQRPAQTTYYRVAIAAGKNMTFLAPNFSQTATLYGFGTDGGLHNFLRFLEDWSGQTLNYKGSLVSLYYSTYNTGTFKCCGDAVYHPPARNYVFDPLFAQPQNMPPGTPMFRDVDNISYRQDFTPH